MQPDIEFTRTSGSKESQLLVFKAVPQPLGLYNNKALHKKKKWNMVSKCSPWDKLQFGNWVSFKAVPRFLELYYNKALQKFGDLAINVTWFNTLQGSAEASQVTLQ